MIIKALNISHNYDKDTALDNVCLEIEKGDFICLIGESGSGKTTLLSILSTLLKPKKGNLFFEDLEYKNIKNIDEFRQKNIGFIFQFHYLINYLNLFENVKLANQKAQDKDILKIFSLLDIENLKDKFPTEISGGQRQRAAIARALINKPKVLFADEPTGNLDSKNAKTVFELFKKLSNEGMTIIVATHNKELAQTANKIYEVKDGKIK
ncbi:ABC transporter ATP-binding protein [Halarcobacter anaerophilus]|uniref:ABC transporter ATP-binding protein n=1 Tax=Halarcobacter anaerophilus TaxID=877500 RepID=UPI001161F454|nr:ABC transporter ATP-binding protein [Halarcobacter anaerophilus]QDF30389.1 ABC transporter, ATP-binding protein, FtsE/LolD family [Halarcobacter anaerophilus]